MGEQCEKILAMDHCAAHARFERECQRCRTAKAAAKRTYRFELALLDGRDPGTRVHLSTPSLRRLQEMHESRTMQSMAEEAGVSRTTVHSALAGNRVAWWVRRRLNGLT
jgi:hypothetical protein